MGVRGLTTFLKDNRQSLCRSAQSDQFGHRQDAAEHVNNGEGGSSSPASATASPTPRPDLTIAVIDAWSIIYSLYLDSHIPWGSGGEYLRFYRVTRRLIRSWRQVGLEPLFVFDGATPPAKHATMIQRLEKHIASARLFYSTRPASRSRPFGWKDDVILPPFTSHAFIHALESEGVATHFVPQGEADAMCVVIAERTGGYVFGRDSDYLILSRGGKRFKGYAPLDMLTWIEGPTVADRAGDRGSPDGFQTVTPPRRSQGPRGSPLLPPLDMQCPTLVVTFIPPQLLCQRLRIPPSVLPLFASLCGNDYTPSSVAWHLDDPSLAHTQKIDRIARVIREQYLSQHMSAAHSADRAVGFVNSVVQKLLVRPFDASAQQEALVDALLEATMPYILPSGEVCCDIFPFCGEESCPRSDTDDSDLPVLRGRRAYARAARRGLIPSVTHGFLYPDRVYLWNVLEDPSMASLKASETLQDVRMKAWDIADQALGGLTYPEPESESEEDDSDIDERTAADSSEDVVKHSDEVLDAILGVADGAPSTSSTTLVDEYSGKDDQSSPELDDVLQHTSTLHPTVEPPVTPSEPVRQMTEWVRSGNRLVPRTRPLPAPPETGVDPIPLQPLENRLQAYLAALLSDITSVRALPRAFHPLAAGIRTALRLASEREKQPQYWRRNELEAVLRGCIGSWAAWARQPDSINSVDSPAPTSPLLTNRNCQLVAQLQAAFTDAHLLAQSLLLLPTRPDDPPVPANNRLTHLIPFVFVSGTAIHTLLNGDTPVGDEWAWSAEEGKIFKRVWAAVVEGLEECVVGLEVVKEGQVKHVQAPSQTTSKRSSHRQTKDASPRTDGGRGGRFDLLSQLPA